MHRDPPCKPPSEAPLFSASDDHGPILLVLMTGQAPALLLVGGPFPGSSGGIPGPGWGLTESHPMDTCSLCSQLLGPRDVEGLMGSCRGWAWEPPEWGGRKELGWEAGAEVLARPQPSVPPLHLQLSSADDPSLLRKPPPPPPTPILYFWKFTGCGASAQSHWLVFWDFFLSFQIFFKQSIFLGAITQKGPVGCVCVLNP